MNGKSEEVDDRRRRFFSAAALTIAAAGLGNLAPAKAQSTAGSTQLRTFETLKQIEAGVLSVGYAEAGPPDGSPVILLHGNGNSMMLHSIVVRRRSRTPIMSGS